MSIREFVVNTAEKYYGKSYLEVNNKAEDALTDFVNNSQMLLLQGFLENDTHLILHTKIQDDKRKSIIFYKTSAQELTSKDGVNNINIITLSSSAAESLYQVLRQIYSPLLANKNDLYSSKLQKNLSELESNLRILTHGKGDGNTNAIFSVEDELDYWKTMGQRKDASKREKEAATAFSELFEDLCEEIRTMQSSPMPEVREAAENVGGILDDVWRTTVVPYSQDRMIHMFDVCGHVICSTVQKVLSSINIWQVFNNPKDAETLTLLSDGLKVIQTWTSACKSLTETYWPNYALHPWIGKSYVPTFCLNFQNRLKEIHDIRSIHNQLNKLLSKNEGSELMTDQLFEPFENINEWICNGPNQTWEAAVSRFSVNLRPSEVKIAEKLKPRLYNTSTKQMLYEFMRYKTLIERPLVKHALSNELEMFVSSLLAMLKSIQDQLDVDEVDVRMHKPPEMSPLVQQVQWAKQMEAKVNDIKTCAEKYLKEFEGSNEVVKVSTHILKELKNMYTQLFEEWSRDIQAQVKSGSLQLSLDKPVVEFSSGSKMMVVNYNPRLVWCELEARALTALGLRAPPAAAALDTLALALRHARALQQVASFHNTLGERMIASTRPMMLQAALDLSSLVQDQKAVYWDDTEQLANYTDKLKNAVMKLESQNSYLTGQHLAIRSIVEKLMDTELLAKQSDWKKKIKDIRDIIEKVEANGYKNTEMWKSHWDWQLYKALECQYIKTLLSLHKHFPTVKVDLVLRGHKVRLQPPLEEIRVQHYHQLRRLVSLPAQFVGLHTTYADKQPIFANIVDKHGWLGNKAVKQLEEALSSLERCCESWTRRAALACVEDLEALCSEHLHEPQDWEVNFKACKAYGQAVAKMSFDDEKIDWIIVGTTTLRREFEAQARNLWACLMSSLQTSCRNDAAALDAFVASAMLTLEDKALPKNAKELAEVSGKQQALQGKMPEMEKLVEALKRKGHLLRTWGGDASVEGTIKEWQKIKELMLSQQQMFEHQAEIVKSSLSGEWENLNSVVEAWLSRLLAGRARYEDARGVPYLDMLERCRAVLDAEQTWHKHQADKNDLLKECEKFNMSLDIPDTWNQAEQLITDYVSLWTIMKEYNDEYESIAEQEWLVFQKKLHLLDEFVSKWTGRLEPYTTVTLFLQQELDKFTDLTTLLKYLRGTDFTERHWREVFGVLQVEYKRPDTLQVKDFLDAALNIKKQIKTLQKISASASSEAAVRSALSELELWFAGARLPLAYHRDKAGQPAPIVKDFKDILSKIEEQQWVVSSVSGGGGDACSAWESRLRAARALVRAANHAQRRWLYLEPILSNDEGELGSKYRKVDQGFRQVTRIIESDPRLSALLQSPRLQPMLDSISEQLLACQSALNQYIDEKRSIFPRFYFLSDDDLLELLGQARAGAEGREAVMQNHLKKLFPGSTGVRLGPGGMSITALCSQYGEIFHLDHPIDIDCPVEMWLKNLETEMRSSLKQMILKCLVTNSVQDQDPFSLPTQILCLTQNIKFTEQAEKAIISKELHKLKANVEEENLYYASAEVEDESERQKRQALILQCAYYMSVIRTLIDNNVVSNNDWLWQKQLRFYLTSTKEVVAKMGLAQISYSYEYLGVNTGQFVRTEFADECFLVLTQALHLGLVGNPFGPAGTGKTESVKALGGLVGRLVLVFNCDEAMDAECMGRLLTGLALCGAWGCFDEFNRLSAPTLAAVSHQLASLLPALQQRRPGSATATLNGKQVNVSEWCGIAATMNPVGRGYGGRRELPAALERVLRPIAMTQPRADQLAKHLLAARCIRDAEQLAEDLDIVFVMASTLLSDQRHYDWGLRALKATIGSCGASLGERGEPNAKNALRRALRLNSVSKLTQEDAERFENIISTVFANVPEEESSTDAISPALEEAVTTLGIISNKLQIQKCKELYEQLQQRMGVVIVGPPGSGKTTIRNLLKTALTQQGKSIVEYIICPKAMSRNWLLGHIDHDTRQWTDGVISSTALEISNQPSDVWSWVVCDGDVDPEWVEALNSVLDDNRLLTLPSGWRIQFGHNVNFIFETDSLEHASPATVSRMGIILLSNDSSCAREVLENWVLKAEYENETAKAALPLLQTVINKCLEWLAAHKSDALFKLYTVSVVKQIITQFEYVIQNIGVSEMFITPEEVIYLALQRSVIGLLKENAVDSFQQEMSELLGPALWRGAAAGGWADGVFLSARLAAREAALRACLHAQHAHLLIVGPDACAKNLLAEYVLKDSNSTVIVIDCTPILEPVDIIAELKRHNVVRSTGKGGRTQNAQVTILARALDRARVDCWGSSPVQSFLLQLIQTGGLWERGGDEEGGMARAGAARARLLATAASPHALQPRLAAAFGVLHLQEPDDDELLELAIHYLRQSVDKNISQKDVAELAAAVLAMFKEITETFYSRPHYKWNASHLRRWCENVKWYSPSNTAELRGAITSEANMIFRDRLVNEEEKASFYSISRSHLKGSSNDGMYFIPKVKGDGVYLETVGHRDWYQTTQKLINQCLTEHEYNVFGETGAEVCSELAILCPAMARATNGEITVCVGSAGLGRRAAAHIVTAALSASLFFVNNPKQFTNNFKNALSTSTEGTRTLLVISESAADITTLAAIESHTHAAPTDQVTPQMLENIKQNLGIVICLDKDQENLLELLEKYPLLYNEAHLVWLERWSAETLRQMPQLVIQRLIKENVTESSAEQHEAIPVEGFVSVYSSLQAEWQRAPARYVNFVKTYYRLVSKKKAALVRRHNMLTSGVEALRRARSEVATLQTEAAKQETALSDKQAKANQALDQIGATVRATTDKKEEMHALKKNIEVENEKLQIRKKEIEEELASVEPIIAAARAAVGDIKAESLSEVRSLRAPPDVVRDVLEGVLRLMGIADTSWHSMKNFLSKRGVKEDIRCLDASQISAEAVSSVQRLLERRGASFEQAAARRASAACAPLAAWVRANLAYAAALARVQPLQAQQRQLHKNLKEAEAQLAALSSGLATVDERVTALKEQLGQHTRDAAAIELSLAGAQHTILAARALLDQLAHEYSAWETDLENISKEISELTLRALLAAAYIVYLPDVTEPQAREYITKWSIGFDDPTFTVINFLSTTEKQLKWDADGLPLDKTAIKNAILIDQILEAQKCGLTPLIIDPDGDAKGWLKNSLVGIQCDFVSQHSEKLQTAVQYAARLGRVLVVTDVDEVHPCWSPLVGGLRAGGAGGAGGGAARLLLYSRDATVAARLPAPLRATLSLLHFTARLDGLTDQLVQYALQQQNPEMNEKSKEIKLKKATLQKQQHELQENLLKDLSSNSDILHDANLLASLNSTRATSTVISEALEAARAIERAARAASEALEPSARRAAILALAVKSMAAQRPLVALPTDTILDVFVDAIRKEADQKNINNDSVVKYTTRRIIERVLLGLHKKDKYIVVLHLLKQVYDDLVPEKLWQVFLGSFDISEDQGIINDIKINYGWIPDQCLKKISQLKAASEDLFQRLSLRNEELWSEFLHSGDVSALGRLKLGAFETVATVAALRPDSLYRAIVVFVDQVLGAGLLSGGAAVARAARRGGARGGRGRAVLLLGAHAADVLAAHAHDRALLLVGIEEGMSAWEAGVEAARGGGWLALVVGASPFTQDLQTFLTQFEQRPTEDFNDEFRLWILSEDREIPPLIANTCINVILEAPEGVKHNLQGTLSAWGQFEGEPKLVRLHACLALFHALAQQRRAYIPQGWSRWYSWEWGEISACATVIRSVGCSAQTARALCLVLYSARVSTEPDRRLLETLLNDCLGEHAMGHSWKPRGLDLQLPFVKQLQAYSAAFDAMPDIDSAQLLGLPANCRVAWEKNAIQDIQAGLRELSSTESALRKSDGTAPMKSLLALWKKLMSGNPLIKGEYNVEKRLRGWWGCVCGGEAAAAARAAAALHRLLAQRARRPHLPLHKVPEEWQLQWGGPAAPPAYLKEFCFRARAALARLDSCPEDHYYMPAELDLRSLFRPERAVWALRVRTAARRACAVSDLSLHVKWDADVSEAQASSGMLVVGLRLCGCEWARGALAPAPPHAAPSTPAPPLLLTYVPKEAVAVADAGSCVVPVFASAARRRVVLEARAPLGRALPPHAAALHAVAAFIGDVD